MLASIHPLGERVRHGRWWLTATAYVVGSTAGGGALGAALGGAGATLDALVHPGNVLVGALLAFGALAAIAFDLGWRGAALPTVRRQVDEDWLHRYRGWVYGLGFGFQLGLGVVTIVTSATTYLVFVTAFLTRGVAAGAIVGGTFGLVRALPILVVARVDTSAQLRAVVGRIVGWERTARGIAVAGAVIVLVAATAVTIAGGSAWWS